jgi:hypothetical protein
MYHRREVCSRGDAYSPGFVAGEGTVVMEGKRVSSLDTLDSRAGSSVPMRPIKGSASEA